MSAAAFAQEIRDLFRRAKQGSMRLARLQVALEAVDDGMDCYPEVAPLRDAIVDATSNLNTIGNQLNIALQRIDGVRGPNPWEVTK